MIFFVSCSLFCLVVLVLVVIAVIYGQTIIASIQFCESSYFKRLNFCTLTSTSHHVPRNPTQPPVFFCPPQSKNVVFIPKITLFTDFCPFFARKTVKYEPILKWFSFSNSSRQVLQHCRAKFSATQTLLHENNYRNFLGDYRFACVSSVVFEAKSIWISRNVLARHLNNLTYVQLSRSKIYQIGKMHFQVVKRPLQEETSFLKSL